MFGIRGSIAVLRYDDRAFRNQPETKELPDMNHLFQTCKTGAMDEYATIEQTIDPVVLAEISGWVLKQTK